MQERAVSKGGLAVTLGGLLACAAAMFATALAPQRSSAEEAGAFKVIVNAGTPASSIPKELISRYFLKKETKWPSGDKVVAVDLPDASAVRERFCKEIHGRSGAAIKAYWQQLIFSGRDTPPVEKASEAEVIAFVESTPGAIGYVSSTASAGKSKIVRVGD